MKSSLKAKLKTVFLFEICETVDERVTMLRSLLSMSDGECVSKFLISRSRLDSLITDLNSELENQYVAQWRPSFSSFFDIFRAIATLSSQLQVDQRKRFSNLDCQACQGFNSTGCFF